MIRKARRVEELLVKCRNKLRECPRPVAPDEVTSGFVSDLFTSSCTEFLPAICA